MTMTETRGVEDQPVSADRPAQADAVSGPGQYQTVAPLTQRQGSRDVDAPANDQGLLVKASDRRERPPGHESHTRTIVKSLTWRVAAFFMTSGIALWITGKFEVAASIGLADTAVKIVVYYLHERLWLKIPYGRARSTDYEI